MIEVFKTNVNDEVQAKSLLRLIHMTFQDYQANFDLEDCDRILRVKNLSGEVDCYFIIGILRKSGWNAEILPDDKPPSADEKNLALEQILDEA